MTPTFIMMVGIPYSGKSSYTKELKKQGYIVHSSDAIRKELSGDEGNQNINEEVFKTLHGRIKNDLLSGNNVVYDACNISYKRRMGFLRELDNSKVNCIKECIVMVTPFYECVNRMNKTVMKKYC